MAAGFVLCFGECCVLLAADAGGSAAAAANSWQVPHGLLPPLQDMSTIGKVSVYCVAVRLVLKMLVTTCAVNCGYMAAVVSGLRVSECVVLPAAAVWCSSSSGRSPAGHGLLACRIICADIVKGPGQQQW
jgi:hypothetical protein